MNGNYQQSDSSQCKADEMNYPIMVADDRLNFWAHCYNYQLGEKIGEGSFGKVFKAMHINSNMIVAFKFIFKVGTVILKTGLIFIFAVSLLSSGS